MNSRSNCKIQSYSSRKSINEKRKLDRICIDSKYSLLYLIFLLLYNY